MHTTQRLMFDCDSMYMYVCTRWILLAGVSQNPSFCVLWLVGSHQPCKAEEVKCFYQP